MKEEIEKRVSNDFPDTIPKVGDLVRIRQYDSVFEAKVLSRGNDVSEGNEKGNFWIQVSYYIRSSKAHSIFYMPADLDFKKYEGKWELSTTSYPFHGNRIVKVEVINCQSKKQRLQSCLKNFLNLLKN